MRLHGVDTVLTWVGEKPVVTVRARAFVRACRPGSNMRYTIETVNGRSGRGILGIKLEPS